LAVQESDGSIYRLDERRLDLRYQKVQNDAAERFGPRIALLLLVKTAAKVNIRK
jgi:hypothetical protein